jgi:hypothetical protein
MFTGGKVTHHPLRLFYQVWVITEVKDKEASSVLRPAYGHGIKSVGA